MEWLMSVWNTIQPYMYQGVEFLVNTGIGAAIGLFIVKKWEAKHSDKNLAETISTKVANGIVNKDILVSLESFNTNQIAGVKNDLVDLINNKLSYMQNIADCIKSMATIMLKFKASSEEERAELLVAINNLNKKENTPKIVVEDTAPAKITIKAVEENKIEETLF